jgi:predicted TPR repeat methyltransferase
MSSSSTTASVRLQREDDPLAHAEALIAQGSAGEAARLLQDLVKAGRGGFLLRAGLVQALSAAGQSDAALAAARETAALYPSVANAALLLGEALLRAGELPDAIGEFQRALRQDPALAEARRQLALAWLEAGEAQKALDAFDEIGEDASGLAPAIAEARAMLARPRSDPRYVRHLFDQFSEDYDSRMLGQLGYRAPAILRQLAGLVMAGGARTILDLGCGTGLSGAAFKDLASRLDGVDLSPAMIEKARARGIYDELTVADMESALKEGGRAYDLILAADTLVYLGDLSAVFLSTARRLAPEGLFLFTAEKKDGEGFELGPKRRWRHSESYLRAEAARAGFDVAGLLACEPRSEAGVPVEGYAVALRKI